MCQHFENDTDSGCTPPPPSEFPLYNYIAPMSIQHCLRDLSPPFEVKLMASLMNVPCIKVPWWIYYYYVQEYGYGSLRGYIIVVS